MSIDIEWVYAAAGSAATAEVRLREAEKAMQAAQSAYQEAGDVYARAVKDSVKSLERLTMLVKELADEKQGIAADETRDCTPEELMDRRLDRDFPPASVLKFGSSASYIE